MPLGNESTEEVYIVPGTGIPGQLLVYLNCTIQLDAVFGTEFAFCQLRQELLA